ncbi:MAG: heavy-metal-associated domain-containing protein [Clostridia bacterium]|nr:heavy-metal-associated domain-containing protein [Clostridia bacterium]
MKKTFQMENLDCANCAAKMETAIQKIDGVTACSVNFFAQKIMIEADDAVFDAVLKKAIKAVHKVDSDCDILV